MRTAPHVGLDEEPAVALRALPPTTLYSRRGKRIFDVVVSLFLILVLLPLAVFITAAIRVGLGRGVLYSQERVGRHGKPFTIWKFRTMRHDRRREAASTPAVVHDRRSNHKTISDPRHTGLGLLLRRLSLDEIPQLWNVLRGDMSLVGPRPELVDVAEERGYRNHVRHLVRPGITGPYQVSDLRRFGDLRDGLDLDAAYVDSVTLRADLTCLLRTVGPVFGRRTAAG